MKTDNPIGPAPPKLPAGSGGGIFLAGYKTYVVAATTAVYAMFLAWANRHNATGLSDYLQANEEAIKLLLLSGGMAAGRAAIAKVFDLLQHKHGA